MEDNLINRREALGKISALAFSLLAAIVSFIGVGFLYPLPRKQASAQFICLESEILPGKSRELKDPQGRKVLLIRKSDGSFFSISTVCTHLGCTVYYRPEADQFECPCHQGVFDNEGRPISGPPQQPLIHYPVELREGKIFIQFC